MCSRYVYGIDFGTSNSGISIWDTQTGSLVTDPSIRKPEPTLIYFPGSKASGSFGSELPAIGSSAIEKYIENNAKGRLLQSIKSFLPDKSFTSTSINRKDYTLEVLCAMVMRYLKAKADAVTRENVKTVTLGRPAVFDVDPERDQLAQQRLESAAKLAGFEYVHFQYEPIAAAFTYEQQIKSPEIALVGDFGGGTSDFAVVKLDPARRNTHNRASDILATGGVSVAGNSLDGAIMWEKITPALGRGEYDGPIKVSPQPYQEMCQWQNWPFLSADRKTLEWMWRLSKLSNATAKFGMAYDLIKNHWGFALFREIEKAKIQLATADSATISFVRPKTVNNGPINLNAQLSSAEFGRITSEEVGKIFACLQATVQRSGVPIERIDSVFLTGGTSRVPAIRAEIAKLFGAQKIRSADDFTAVVDGLALSAPICLASRN